MTQLALKFVEKTVRDYFNNAIIIDDQMDMKKAYSSRKTKTTKIKDNEIVLSQEDEMALLEIAATEESSGLAEIKSFHKPHEVYKNFIKTGIITHPIQYKSNQKMKRQIDNISELLVHTKILIVDWNLEDITGATSTTEMGQATRQIIKKFLEKENGLRCVVIYTQENRNDVLNKINEEYEVIDGANFFFQDKNMYGDSSLFGFIMDKQLSPDEIINKIVETLMKDKSTTLHFMACANKLDQELHKTLQKFNAPFEKVMFTQILTSEIPNQKISRFINNTLLSGLLDDANDTETHFLFERKKEKLLAALIQHPLNQPDIEYLSTTLALSRDAKNLIINEYIKPKFMDEITAILTDPNVNSLESFISMIDLNCKKYVQINDKRHIKMVREAVLFLTLWDNFIYETKLQGGTNDNFKQSFLAQTIRFTHLMKYSDDNVIQTGSILKNINGKYYLCITPLCDTFRPEDIDNKYKFIVGEATNDKDEIKKSNAKYHCSALPIEGDQLIFIKWKFYQIETFDKSAVHDGELFKNLMTLKRDYVQNIMNKYIAYQSRAGVNEMFFKESNYIENFLGVIFNEDESDN
ncbi:response regulator receiver domain [Paenibacillus sp. HWE-109]|uniref:response regulator receiver domain n=1 Tax=Paenibacillus sp. HWE-109 TaxID=1306526 RepID=UPI001EDFA193|nr:response regulator receiver domain [Paenibacillus sp. HWE-109]UKS26634.1 response regulator receiver domain [Paenibacillus sp. HWE-109]